mmetsp:Transcript_62078/g.201248  ORF Transcript_62078/g.201248 Transcript_62078/m.201248 type:complete len:161 (-) Transcript_62078:13-495(-)
MMARQHPTTSQESQEPAPCAKSAHPLLGTSLDLFLERASHECTSSPMSWGSKAGHNVLDETEVLSWPGLPGVGSSLEPQLPTMMWTIDSAFLPAHGRFQAHAIIVNMGAIRPKGGDSRAVNFVKRRCGIDAVKSDAAVDADTCPICMDQFACGHETWRLP